MDDEREFFVATWCLHPRFIPDEKILFILKPHVPYPVEDVQDELLGLRYLVRIRVVAFQDWNTPSVSPGDGGPDGGDNDHGGPDVAGQDGDNGDESHEPSPEDGCFGNSGAHDDDDSPTATTTATTPALTAAEGVATAGWRRQ